MEYTENMSQTLITVNSKFSRVTVTFISRIFYFQIISEFLNLRVSDHVFYKVYSVSLCARTLNSRDNQFTNISKN